MYLQPVSFSATPVRSPGTGASPAPRPAPLRLITFEGARRKIMSYNTDGLFRVRGHIAKHPKNVAALAEAIRRENPDVIALQEAGDPEFMAWFNQTHLDGAYPNIVSLRNPHDPKRRLVFMAKPEMRIADVQSHAEEQGRGEKGKRDFLQVTVQTDTGYRMTLFNVHFRSMVQGEAESLPARLAEAESATRILNRFFRRNPGEPVLVMGDFNSRADTPAGLQVLNAIRQMSDENPHNDLFEVTTPTRQVDGRMAPSFHKPGVGAARLDYIFCSRLLKDRIVEGYVAGRLKEEPWKSASRHMPLVVVIEEPDDLPAAGAAPSPTRPAFAGTPRRQWIA